jgi:Domain of unknown function (DUF4160)
LAKIGVNNIEMPTILNQNGFSVRIRRNDREPMHVHVFMADGEAKININSAEVVKVWKMSAKDVRKAEEIVSENSELLAEKWREIHEAR